MSDELKQEFEAARIKHLLFKSKLRSYLYGSGTAEAPIRDPHVCALGQWIDRVALPQFGHLPEMRELDDQHQQMHHVANRLMDLYQAGQRDAAVAGLVEVNRRAEEMTSLLDTLEAKLRTEGR